MVSNVLSEENRNGASYQFQDMFVNGTTAKNAMVSKLPWENGKKFKELKLNESGYEYRLPKTPVAVVDLHGPSRHKLLVRYCTDCVGVMALVHDWNEAVEESLAKNADDLLSSVRLSFCRTHMLFMCMARASSK
jgi:hypothetical protein